MTELEKLKKYLDENGIRNEWNSVISDIDQIIVYDPKHEVRLWDVVSHQFSYGGDKGLLEIYGSLCTDVIGWLTADDVIKILDNYKKNGGVPIDSMDDIKED